MATTADPTPIEFMQLVADAQRWQLLQHLSDSDRRVGELAELLGKAPNLVSYHLGELRAAGLVVARRSSADGRDTYYRLDPARCGAAVRRCPRGAASRARARATGRWTHRAPGAAGSRERPVPLHRELRALADRRGGVGRGARGKVVSARSAGSHPKELHPDAVRRDGRARHRHLRSADHALRPLRPRPLRSRHHVVRSGARGLPRVPGTSGHRALEHAGPVGRSDGYPAFVRAADEIEERVGLLITQLHANDATRGARHGDR